MRRIKLLALFVATLFAAGMWATPVSLGDGTALEWEIVGTTLVITNTVQGGSCAMPDYNVDGDGEKSYPGWYSQAANITAISLPEYLTRIGNHAFAGMTNEALTSLTIPATVTSIGDQAIRISHLQTLTCLPTTAPTPGISIISEHAEPFTIVYPCGSGTNYINSWAVYYPYLTPATPCDEAKPDYNPGGLIKYSSYYDFHASTGVLRIYGSGSTGEYMNADQQLWATYRNLITSVVVEEGSPYGITYIAPYTFDGLTELTSVTLPSTLVAISSYAFANCTKLTSITIPSSVQYIDDYAFLNCTGLQSITSLATTPPAPNDPNSTQAFDGVNKSIPVYVPAASVDAYKAADQWKGFTNIQAIPEPVSLGDGTNLQYQLLTIQSGQPQKALVITLINENNTGTMPDYNVDGDGEKSYPGWYSERANIASISLPEYLTHIGNHAFAGMTNEALTSLTIPATVTSIGDQAIRISHLQTLTCLPTTAPTPGISIISEHAEPFTIVYPCGSGTNYINSWVVYYPYLTPATPCNEAKPDYNPGGLIKYSSYYDFHASTGVLRIYGSGSTGEYMNADQQLWATYRNLITSVVVEEGSPYGITLISSHTFSGLTELTSVTLPSTLVLISDSAFANCTKLASITIPSSVQYIDDYAFLNCTGLQSITSLATTPPAPNDPNSTQAFDGVNKSIPVYVPAASINAYRTADQWKDFTNIRAIGSGALNPDHPQNPGNYRLTLNVSDEAAGSVTGAGLYPQGTAVTITATANTGYSFTQWSDGVTDASRTITLMRDSTLTAEFAINKFTVTFVDEDGTTVLASDEYNYGTTPVAPADPTKAATAQYTYTFTGWTPEVVAVTEDATYTATYSQTVNKYTITFVDEDGTTVLKSGEVEYGATPVAPADPTKAGTAQYTYTFDGWTPEVVAVTEDATYTATYLQTINKFTVTFVDEDGTTVLASNEYEYGATPVAPTDPTKAATAQYTYAFAGWTPEIVAVTEDATYTATYSLTSCIISDQRNISALPVDENTHVIVESAGHLVVDVPATIGWLTLTMAGTASAQVTGIEDLTASTIDALLTVTARQWFAMGVPFEVSVASGIQINGANAAAIFGTDYVMDEYDGALRASVQDGWKRVASAGTLHPGTLYMIYTASATSWRLIAANPAAIAEAEAVVVAANPSSLGEHHAGWNGIANARLSNSSASLNGVTYATFYNNQYSVYETVIMAEQTLIPAEPFFVQAPAAGSVLFEADDAAPAPWRVAATDMPTMTVALTNEAQTFTDKAYITTSQDKPNTYTIGRDLEKMQAVAPVVPQLWIEAYNMHLAAYETSFTGNGQIIPLGLYAPAQGSYTIAISNVPTELDITLTKNGQTIWDISESAYVASLQAGNNAGYALRISQKSDVVTDINTLNGENTNATVRKMIVNGQLIILHGDKAYTTHGQELR